MTAIDAAVRELVANRRPVSWADGYASGDRAWWLREPLGPIRKEIVSPGEYESEHPGGGVILYSGRGKDRVCAAVLPLEPWCYLEAHQIVAALWS